MTPHPHADLIHAWADGAEIEVFHEPSGSWFPFGNSMPAFVEELQYRIKPSTLCNEITVNVHGTPDGRLIFILGRPNLRCTFDAHTGELLTAEVIKP